MEANGNEPLPVLHMCRLCLNYFGDCIEIEKNGLYIVIWKQIKKYFHIEVKTVYSIDSKISNTVSSVFIHC